MAWKERLAVDSTAKPAVSFAISLPVITVTMRSPGVALAAIVTVAVHWVSVEHCWLENVMPVPKLKIEDAEKCVLVPLITTWFNEVPSEPAPGETLATTAVGAVFVPVPISAISIWLELDASVIVTLPVRFPVAVGSKPIHRLQLESAGITPPQSSLAVKSPVTDRSEEHT